MELMRTSLLALGAICAFVGCHHLMIALRRPGLARHWWFGALALTLAMHSCLRLWSMDIYDLSLLRMVSWWIWLTEAVAPWLLLGFVSTLTQSPRRALWLTVFAVPLGTLVVLHLLLPYGYAEASAGSIITSQYPWGEERSQRLQDYTVGYYVLLFAVMGVYALCMAAGWRHTRQTNRLQGIVLMTSLSLILVAIAATVGRDLGWFNGIPLIDHSFMTLVLLMSLVLSDEAVRAGYLEQQLHQSHRDLQVTLDAVGDGVITCTSSGDIAGLNQVAAGMLQVDASHAIGRSLADTLTLRDADHGYNLPVDISDVACASGAFAPQLRVEVVRKDLAPLPVMIDGAEIGDQSSMRTVVILRDLGERLQLEQRLHQANKMESLGQLAGGVAHDFNNVLAGIVGAAEIIGGALDADDRNQRFVKLITNAAGRAGDLNQRLMTFARQRNTQLAPISIQGVVDDVVRILERSIDPRITIANVPSEDDPIVMGDAAEIQSALLNLGINARDAIGDQGAITITTDVIDLDDARAAAISDNMKPGPAVRIRVTDTGSGISDDLLPRIFDPFFTTKSVGKGTGLGLAAVHGCIATHGGGIQVASLSGRGTTFDIYLPRCDVSRRQSQQHIVIASGNGARVLVVDDDETIRATTCEQLTSLGYHAEVATDGATALEQLGTDTPGYDLILLDLVMPIMRGDACLHAIRNRFPALPVIMCSGNADFENTERHSLSGASGHLPKPFRLHQLATACQQALNS